MLFNGVWRNEFRTERLSNYYQRPCVTLPLQMTIEDFRDMFHHMDNKLQSSILSIKFLSDTYGDKENRMLFDFRSILFKWIGIYFYSNLQLDKSPLFSDLYSSVI